MRRLASALQRTAGFRPSHSRPFPTHLHAQDEDCRCAVRWVHASYLSALATLCLNLVAALVLASGGVPKKGVDVLYAFLNLLLFSVFGMYGFYMAYKGLATQNKRLCYQYLGIQAVLFLFMCVSMLAGGANFNGWLNLQRASDSEKLRGFWIAWTLAEASLWTLNVLVCVVGMQRVWALKKTGRPLSLSGAVSSSSRPAAGIGSFGRGGTGAASA